MLDLKDGVGTGKVATCKRDKAIPGGFWAWTAPTVVPCGMSSGTLKKYWACSKTGGETVPSTMLMLTRAFGCACRPPPS